MSTALVILPDFLLILSGFSLARWMGFQPGFWDGLEKLIYYILFPALLFRSLVLAGASLPMGLIAVGAGLKAMRLDESPAMMSYLLAVKLLALPLIAWAISRVLDLNHLYLTSVILLAALPPASSAFILAARMGGEGKPVATLISTGTLLSMVTMPFWIAWLL